MTIQHINDATSVTLHQHTHTHKNQPDLLDAKRSFTSLGCNNDWKTKWYFSSSTTSTPVQVARDDTLTKCNRQNMSDNHKTTLTVMPNSSTQHGHKHREITHWSMMLNCKDDEAPFQRIFQVENNCKPTSHQTATPQTSNWPWNPTKQKNGNEPITFWNVKKDTRK
jgi:hypothetical protein